MVKSITIEDIKESLLLLLKQGKILPKCSNCGLLVEQNDLDPLVLSYCKFCGSNISIDSVVWIAENCLDT